MYQLIFLRDCYLNRLFLIGYHAFFSVVLIRILVICTKVKNERATRTSKRTKTPRNNTMSGHSPNVKKAKKHEKKNKKKGNDKNKSQKVEETEKNVQEVPEAADEPDAKHEKTVRIEMDDDETASRTMTFDGQYPLEKKRKLKGSKSRETKEYSFLNPSAEGKKRRKEVEKTQGSAD